MSVSAEGDVRFTPNKGEEKVLKREFVKSAFGYRCQVSFGDRRYDLYDIMLRVFYPDRDGYTYPRSAKRQLCTINDMVILPIPAVPYDLEDIYVAYYIHGDHELVTAANTLEDFSRKLSVIVGGAINYTERQIRKFFDSTEAPQPIPDEIYIGMKCSDEDKPDKYFRKLNPYTFGFLRAYERTGEVGKKIIRRFIDTAPTPEIRTYLRWLYTMRCDHAETAKALDMQTDLVRFSVRRSAIEWVSDRLDENPNLITLILF